MAREKTDCRLQVWGDQSVITYSSGPLGTALIPSKWGASIMQWPIECPITFIPLCWQTKLPIHEPLAHIQVYLVKQRDKQLHANQRRLAVENPSVP